MCPLSQEPAGGPLPRLWASPLGWWRAGSPLHPGPDFPFYKDASRPGLRPTVMTPFERDSVSKEDPVSKGHVLRSRGRGYSPTDRCGGPSSASPRKSPRGWRAGPVGLPGRDGCGLSLAVSEGFAGQLSPGISARAPGQAALGDKGDANRGPCCGGVSSHGHQPEAEKSLLGPCGGVPLGRGRGGCIRQGQCVPHGGGSVG